MHRSFRPRILLLSLTALLSLSACAPLTTSDPGGDLFWMSAERAKAEDRIADRYAEVADAMRALCVSPENKAYFRKTACLPSGITEKMLSDRSRITPAEKKAAKRVFAATHRLNETTRNLMIGTGITEYMDEAIASREHTDPIVRDLQKRLLSREITWGEYNLSRRNLAQLHAEGRHD